MIRCSSLNACYGIMLVLFIFVGCRYGKTHDSIEVSTPNQNHTYRATIIKRHYLLDNGMEDASPTTYVLLSKDMGAPSYKNGQEFEPGTVVMRPSQCGPLRLEWISENTLKIICEHCGLAVHSIGSHASKVESVQLVYEDFPNKSFWE